MVNNCQLNRTNLVQLEGPKPVGPPALPGSHLLGPPLLLPPPGRIPHPALLLAPSPSNLSRRS